MILQSWQAIAADKRASVRSHLERTGYPVPIVNPNVPSAFNVPIDGYLTARQRKLTEMPPEVVCAKLTSGCVTSEELTVSSLENGPALSNAHCSGSLPTARSLRARSRQLPLCNLF